MEEFKYGGTNITALRLLDPERAEVQRVVRDWVYDEARKGRKLQLGHTSSKVIKFNISVRQPKRAYNISGYIISFVSGKYDFYQGKV